MFDGLLSSAAPLLLASLGALISECAGTLAIFTEGFIEAGAFAHYFFARVSGSALAAAFFTFFLTGVLGWAFARAVQKLNANPFIASLGANLLLEGGITSLSLVLFGEKAVLRGLGSPGLARSALLEKIPVLGKLIFPLSPFVLAALVFYIAGDAALNRTMPGLRLRAAGASPLAVRERGLNPDMYSAAGWAFAAALAGLAGAALTWRSAAFVPFSAGGRGWLALAAVYLGMKNIWGCAAAALVFAAAERVSFAAQGTSLASATALQGLPPLIALLLYITVSRKRRREM
jgi:simple sugar transport system permease protein